MRQQPARKNRPSTRAGFNLPPAPPPGLYPAGTPDFLFWQCREAALTALNGWEVVGARVTRWARSSNPKRLDLVPNNGDDLNAYYDGQSLAFFEHTTGNTTTFSGASTDVVAHETGHAVLDSIRPDLWDSLYIETGAFHEAFGDCVAILTALSDQATRIALLKAAPNLGRKNFVEATAEDLSAGIKRALGPKHPAAEPRHAWNTYKFAAKAAALSAATYHDITRRLGVSPKVKLFVRPLEIAGEMLAQASNLREVPLGALSKQLAGVVAVAWEHVLVGAVAKTAAILSGLPDPCATQDEVHAFVSTLLDTHNIAFAEGKPTAVRAAANVTRKDRMPTHTVTVERGRKVLRRARFACPFCGSEGVQARSHAA